MPICNPDREYIEPELNIEVLAGLEAENLPAEVKRSLNCCIVWRN